MPIARNMNVTRDFILKNEKDSPPDKQTVFIVGAMAGWLQAALNDRVASTFKQGDETVIRDILRAGLKGWRNFRDEHGAEVQFKLNRDGQPSDESLSILDMGSSVEIAMEIMGFNKLAGDELKN